MEHSWPLRHLKDCANWYSGGTPSKSKKEYWGGDIPWISAKSLKEFFISDSEDKVTSEAIGNGTRLVPKNTILFIVRGMSLKTEFRVGITTRPVAFNQDLKALIPTNDVDADFLFYAIKSKTNEILPLVEEAGHGTGVLPTSIIQSVEIPLPSKDEQKLIAGFFRAVDDKIQLNRQMNATLEAMAQALFKSWFVDFDPVIDNALAAGNPIPEPLLARAETRKALGNKRKPLPEAIQKQFPSGFVFSEEMGWIPEGWEIFTIGDISEVIDCLHSKKPSEIIEDTGNILLQLNNIRDDGLLDLQKKYFISDEDYKKWVSRIEVIDGDCVITNVGRVGAVAIVPRDVSAAIGRNMTAIRLKQHVNLKGFLITLLNSQYMKQEIDHRTDVGTILNALNVKSIPKLRFLNASQPLQEFEKQAQPILTKRQDLLKENMGLSKLRDTLLPKLLSGQLRIPDAEKLAAEAL